eukprot:GHRQ01007425.1.p1 GENE.GHRQ01007425.1~~GHRQ01007425.1.p1  ORF type:complete len:346 (+),score=136.04 GHRQ01007425.1:213-1250(+)
MLQKQAGTGICAHRSYLKATLGHLRGQRLIRASCSAQQVAAPAALQRARTASCSCSRATAFNTHLDSCSASIACSRRSNVVCQAAAAAAMPTADGPSGLSKVLANIRAAMFAAWTFTLAIPLFIIMMTLALPVLALDKFRRLAQHFVNNLWAIASTTPFYSVQIEGRENLPSSSTPAVYVANHQSFMDIYSLFHLQRPFKFISKTSNFLIPIVGWSMFLTGHIMLNRVDRRSQLKCLQTCIEMLSRGASCLFFPEGTRSRDKVLGGFKKGAFSVAVKAGVPVVPITLLGTGDIMPSGREGQMYGGAVKIVVHPMIQAAGNNADKVRCWVCVTVIVSSREVVLKCC